MDLAKPCHPPFRVTGRDGIMAICMLDALKAERAQALLHSALGGVEEPAAGARGAQRRGRDKMED